ncbi:MAG: DUF4810 domain-containing protein [Desulfobulbaceae bacterium]|nr:DUF4810 domain-containing protein [Desulfobulbaceae bacterium]
MKRKILLLVVFITSAFFGGCAPQQMYYLGNYSKTLYSLEKNQTEEALINHKQELEKIVAESKVRNLPVPPGIYAELGYINFKANNSQEAIKLFQTETQLYPESKHLMDRLIQSAEAKENTESDVSGLPTSKNSISN